MRNVLRLVIAERIVPALGVRDRLVDKRRSTKNSLIECRMIRLTFEAPITNAERVAAFDFACKTRKLSVAAVARPQMGCSLGHLGEVLRGLRNGSDELRERIAVFIGGPVDVLFSPQHIERTRERQRENDRRTRDRHRPMMG